MAILLALAAGISDSLPATQQPEGGQAPAPNWTEPTTDDWRESADADRTGARAPEPNEIAFTFTLQESARATSAGVYDTQGKLLRTLWSARPYRAGAHRAIWDGKDDYGNPAPAANYTIRVLAGNVHYDWDGVIGVTEDSLAGPHNWDATASFPSSIVFLNGKAYVAGGYNEGRISAFVFDEKTPFTVAPLNMALFGAGQFEATATDGKRVYFSVNHYWLNGSNAVVAFEPDGAPWSFPEGTVIPPTSRLGAYFVNTWIVPHALLKDLRGVDVANYKESVITGIAVERNGNLLASAHGARGGSFLRQSLDAILLWDKTSGAAIGKVAGISNPQKMVFDRNDDLWVIEGGPTVQWYWDRGARLARIRDVGGKNEVSEPIQGLENPVDVAVNPANGHIFVADGGASQQVKEFDPATGKLLSTLGTPGGYGQGSNCNPAITPTKFWLDFNGRGTGWTHPWIAVDEGGDVWVGDFTASRVLRFHEGKPVAEIEMGHWDYQVSVPRRSPTRVFAGWNGMIEYKIDYSLPIEPKDPLDPAAKHAWKAVRNWYPCFLEAEAGQQDSKVAEMMGAETLANGQTFGLVGFHGGPFDSKNALVKLPEDGHIEVVNNRVSTFKAVALDEDLNYFRAPRTGAEDAPHYTITRYSVTGFDAQGFPQWDNGTATATLAPDLAKGEPIPWCNGDHCDMWPTEGGIIPIYAGLNHNTVVAPGEPAFHLGGLPVGGSTLQWQTMPEKPTQNSDGHGTYAYLKNNNLGFEARAIHRDIFAAVNGNWGHFSCQFFQYRDDGLLVGQFGWRTEDRYRREGIPNPWRGEALAPGFCGNIFMFKVAEVGKDYYLYHQDEGYRAGLHRWHISNLDSIYEMKGTGAMGGTVQLAR